MSIPFRLSRASTVAHLQPVASLPPAPIRAEHTSWTPHIQTIWADVDDKLMPMYQPRDQETHPRASPGLACLKILHEIRMLLVLPGLDSRSEKSDICL